MPTPRTAFLFFLLFAFFGVAGATPNSGPYSANFRRWCELYYAKQAFIWLLKQYFGIDLSKSKLQWSLLLKRVAKYFTEQELHHHLEHVIGPFNPEIPFTPFTPFLHPESVGAGAKGGGPEDSGVGAGTATISAAAGVLRLAQPIQQNLPQDMQDELGFSEGEDGIDPDEEGAVDSAHPAAGPSAPARASGPAPSATAPAPAAASPAAAGTLPTAAQPLAYVGMNALAAEHAAHEQDHAQVQQLQQQINNQPALAGLANQHQQLVIAQQQVAAQILQLQQLQTTQQQNLQAVTQQLQTSQTLQADMAALRARMAAREEWAASLMRRR